VLAESKSDEGSRRGKGKAPEESRKTLHHIESPSDFTLSPSASPVKQQLHQPPTLPASTSSPRKRKISETETRRPFSGLEDVQRSPLPMYPRYFSHEKKDKAFPRKPRSLELNWAKNSEHRNLFAARSVGVSSFVTFCPDDHANIQSLSSLDGSVQFWSFTQQRYPVLFWIRQMIHPKAECQTHLPSFSFFHLQATVFRGWREAQVKVGGRYVLDKGRKRTGSGLPCRVWKTALDSTWAPSPQLASGLIKLNKQKGLCLS